MIKNIKVKRFFIKENKMNTINEALHYIENATKILDDHVNDPKNYNTIYCNDFELKSWELFKIMNEIRHISNRYAIA